MADNKEKPYKPSYSGFDVEQTERAQQTAERARDVQAGKGEYADQTYVEEGPKEAARRRGEAAEDVKASVERADEQD